MKKSRGPWWCLPLQGIAFLLLLANCVALVMAGFRSLLNFVLFGGAAVLALWAVVELPVQARKEGRSLPLRVLICVGMVLACWLVPELVMWVLGYGISYWFMVRLSLGMALSGIGFK